MSENTKTLQVYSGQSQFVAFNNDNNVTQKGRKKQTEQVFLASHQSSRLSLLWVPPSAPQHTPISLSISLSLSLSLSPSLSHTQTHTHTDAHTVLVSGREQRKRIERRRSRGRERGGGSG